MGFINIGFGNLIQTEKVLCVLTPDSAPTKRMIQNAKEEHRLIDATQGRRTKTVFVCDGDRLVLCALAPETVSGRIQNKNEED